MKIVILGAGAAGTSLFVNLVDHAIQTGFHQFLELTIVEKTGDFGPGLAYSTQLNSNLLNTPSFDLGVPYGHKIHFWNWIVGNEDLWHSYIPELTHYDRDTPFPRKLYALYLRAMFNDTIRKSKKAGVIVRLITDEVIDSKKNGNEHLLKLKNTKPFQVDIICCCLGLGKIGKYPHLKNTPGYMLFPGNDEMRILKIPNDEKVAVLGSRLSAIDSLLLLEQTNRKEKVFVISRTANMPNVVSKHVKYPRKHLTKENLLAITKHGKYPLSLRKLTSLIMKEYAFHEGKKLSLRQLTEQRKAPIVKFRYDIIKTTGKIRAWQAALYSTNDIANLTWNLLDNKTKKIIFKNYYSLFQNQRIAMPISSAKKVYQLYHNKIVSFHKDLEHVEFQNGQYVISFYSKKPPISVKHIIDASGLTGDVMQTNNVLVKNLLKNQLVEVDDFGFIKISPNTMRALHSTNIPQENIYILGGLIQGTHIAGNLMESIVHLSHLISEDIFATIATHHRQHRLNCL